MSALTVRGLTAGYGSVDVLRGVDLTVRPCEISAVLGPSGCGKTTLLRVLAGHHRASGGEVRIDDRLVASADTHVRPERRAVTVVPQEGALFPHLDVTANVAFGLRGAPDAAERTAEMLELVGLADQARRHPHQLSGGQQQRVAVARALAPRPAFVLLDEPFSALDAHLREQLRTDVRDLLRAERATAVLVTHDQSEALTLADTVAVMRHGMIAQQGAPQDVYARPVDAGVARFVGDSVILDVQRLEGTVAVTGLGEVPVAGDPAGQHVMLRPEQIRIAERGASAVVETAEFQGASTMVTARLDDGSRVTVRSHGVVTVGAQVHLAIDGAGWLID